MYILIKINLQLLFVGIPIAVNQRKPLLDILLLAKKEGRIDNQGVGEEIDNLISAVSIQYTILCKEKYKITENYITGI